MKAPFQVVLLLLLAAGIIIAAILGRYHVEVTHDARTKMPYLIRHDRWTGRTAVDVCFPGVLNAPAESDDAARETR